MDGDLDLVVNDADGIGPDARPEAIEPTTVDEAEAPAVPGAGDRPIEHDAVAEWGALVRAGVVDGVIGPLLEEDGDGPPLDRARLAHTLDDLSHPCHRMERLGIQCSNPHRAARRAVLRGT